MRIYIRLNYTRELHQAYHNAGGGRISIWFALRQVMTCSEQLIGMVRDAAAELNTGIHANTIVEAANGHDVTDSIINGKLVMKNREVLRWTKKRFAERHGSVLSELFLVVTLLATISFSEPAAIAPYDSKLEVPRYEQNVLIQARVVNVEGTYHLNVVGVS